MTPALRLILLNFCGLSWLGADTRGSASYTVVTETLDSGGQPATSPAYRNTPSLGSFSDLATTTASASAQPGFIAQLAATTRLDLTANAVSLEETGILQLAAWELFADGTRASLAPATVAWSAASGPIAISPVGGVTAAPVYQDSAATAAGTYSGFNASLALIVLNTAADNYGSYANDGLRDDWQVRYFGTANPNAAPGLDPDHDGLANAIECAAALIPTSAASTFTLAIQPVANQPTQRRLSFGPWNSSSTYTVEASTDLSHWSPLSASTTTDSGSQRTVTDLAASQAKKFYRVAVASTVVPFTYANDGLPDDWQARYFGVANLNAAPTLDPDQDGFDNTFEFLAGLIPTDATSHFDLTVQPVPGQPTQRRIVFSPRYDTATYTVESSTDLSHWAPLGSFTTVDEGIRRTVTDLAASQPNMHYRVCISKP